MVNGEVLNRACEEKKQFEGSLEQSLEASTLRQLVRWGLQESQGREDSTAYFPEQKLLIALLERSIFDLRGSSWKEEAYLSREWIVGPHEDGHPFSFPQCCEYLGVEPIWVVKKLVKKGTLSPNDLVKAEENLALLESSLPEVRSARRELSYAREREARIEQYDHPSSPPFPLASLNISLDNVVSQLATHLNQVDEADNVALFAVPELTYNQGRALVEVYRYAAFPRRLTVLYNDYSYTQRPSWGERYDNILLAPATELKRALQSLMHPSCFEAVFLPSWLLEEATNLVGTTSRDTSLGVLRQRAIIIGNRE